MSCEPILRFATNEDSPGVLSLIESVFQEFDYVASAEHGENDLTNLDRDYFGKGGAFWVMEADSRIVGTHGALRGRENGICTFRRLYLAKDFRGGDYGRQLMQIAINWARENQMHRIEFWSDIKFSRAHRFFAKFGFVGTDELRSSHDGLQPYVESFYYLDLE